MMIERKSSNKSKLYRSQIPTNGFLFWLAILPLNISLSLALALCYYLSILLLKLKLSVCIMYKGKAQFCAVIVRANVCSTLANIHSLNKIKKYIYRPLLTRIKRGSWMAKESAYGWRASILINWCLLYSTLDLQITKCVRTTERVKLDVSISNSSNSNNGMKNHKQNTKRTNFIKHC